MSPHLLSLCMIVRDEESSLDRCLESAQPYVDEIVVVDTGSADATRERARAAGARVIAATWEDDFAAARNVALDQAAGTFALVLDADEWIEAGSHPASLRALLQGTERDAFAVDLADHLDGGGVRRLSRVRLFRNCAEHRYVGAFRERIPCLTEGRDATCPFPPSGLTVGHDGNRIAHRIGLRRAERHHALLRRRIAAHPDEAESRYHLATERVPMLGGRAIPGSHVDEGLLQLQWIAEHLDCIPGERALHVARLHAAALIAANRVDEAEAVLKARGDRGVACELLRADVEMNLADADPRGAERALERLRRCFDADEKPLGADADPALAGPVARARAAEALLLSGRPDAAREMAREATQLNDGGAAPWNALAAIEQAAGNRMDAMRAYLEGLRADPRDPWTWAGLGRSLLAQGNTAESIEPLQNAAVLAAGWNPVDEALAAALLLEDRAEEMEPLFADEEERWRGTGAKAALILAAAACRKELPPDPDDPDVQGAIQRILGALAEAGRPDLLTRLAEGLRRTALRSV